MGENVNRQKALGVLHEIVNCCDEFRDIRAVSITDSTAQIRMKSTGYEIYMKCALNDARRRCLTPILEKHQLKIAKLKDAIILYKPEVASEFSQVE
jgi:hypothetical protein